MNDKSNKDRHWYALYTRPRFEKKVDADLTEKNLESFLPLHTVVRLWSDRKKKIKVPLFSSYVFVHTNLAELYLCLQTTGVIKTVSFNGVAARISENQLNVVRRILFYGYSVQPHHYLSIGDQVEINSGPLKGVTGFITEYRGKNRLIISLDKIRQSIAIDIDLNCLNPISTIN